MIFTMIFGYLNEKVLGSFVFLNINLLLLFYWIWIYFFVKRKRKGAGFSSIYFSYVSSYCSNCFISDPYSFYKVIYLVIPYIFNFAINKFAERFSIETSQCSNEVHIISLFYGYQIIFLYYISQYIIY